MLKTTQGNLLDLAEEGEFDVIIHGCNCFCTMGAGIAAQIKQRYPSVFYEDCKTVKGDINKLGTFSCAVADNYSLIVVNAYTQFRYGGNKSNVDYVAIRSALTEIKKQFGTTPRYGIPAIGCGLAGGDWNIVEMMINEVMYDCDVTYVEFK